MTIGGTTIDPFFGYGTGAAAASSPYAGTGVTSGDASAQPYLDAYESMMAGYEQQRSSVFGDVMSNGLFVARSASAFLAAILSTS